MTVRDRKGHALTYQIGMYSKKFSKFIEIWQKDFAIERTIEESSSVDKDKNPIPWYTYPAIEYLSQFDYKDMEVFEYGCGNSSLFWAKRVKGITSIEDNSEWYEKWCRQEEFKQSNLNIKLRKDKTDYCTAIREDNKKYDVIVIDGKYRGLCAKEATNALKVGGIIILDDSDRVNTSKEYFEAIATLKAKDLIQVDFYGFCPMNNYPKTTSVFLSRDFNFKSKYKVQPINGIGNLWGMGRKRRKEFYKENM